MQIVMDEVEELIHPFWLGLLMLFTVVFTVGSVCFLRKKCGSNFCHLFNRLRGRHDLIEERVDKLNHRVSTIPHNWTPMYIPPAPSMSPKLFNLVRTMRITSIDRGTIMIKPRERLEDVAEEESRVKTSEIDQNGKDPTFEHDGSKNRNLETARRFYASMRQTTLAQTDSSVDSSTNELTYVPTNRLMRSTQRDKLKFFQTQGFFHSITRKN